jgi:hypothetical protein
MTENINKVGTWRERCGPGVIVEDLVYRSYRTIVQMSQSCPFSWRSRWYTWRTGSLPGDVDGDRFSHPTNLQGCEDGRSEDLRIRVNHGSR